MTEAPTPSTVSTGAVLAGRYRLEEEIGRGGAGRVFRAHDDRLDRAVAVKVLTDLGETAITRFRREAAAAARIRHPNVVTLFDAGVDGLPYLVMSLVAGSSLGARVSADGPLDPNALRRLAVDLLAGLEATHRAGVLHRDLTPRNVLFDADGSALLADFGIARGPEDPALTAEHTVMGTRPFVAPERLRGEDATEASDLYAVGITLRYAATGSHAEPMPGDHPMAPLVDACTAADPARRPASARDAASHLDVPAKPGADRRSRSADEMPDTQAMTMVTVSPTPAGSTGADTEADADRAASRPGRSRRPAAAVGVLVALGAIALVGTISGGGAGGDPSTDVGESATATTDRTGAPAAPTFDPDAPADSARRLAEWLRAQDGASGG